MIIPLKRSRSKILHDPAGVKKLCRSGGWIALLIIGYRRSKKEIYGFVVETKREMVEV
jgi:hypothetical protein